MNTRTISMDDRTYEYLVGHSVREHPVLAELREATRTHQHAGMQIAPDQAQFMTLLVKLIGARRTIEVGVFTGYSSLVVALALPPDGHITACDVNEQWTSIARRYWQEAGVEQKIDLYLAPALQTLDRLVAHGQASTYDFAFIDADKQNYWGYYERALTLLRPGGLIAVDNTLWSGRPADPAADDAETQAIRAFNQRLFKDSRVRISLVPIGDGMTLALKLRD